MLPNASAIRRNGCDQTPLRDSLLRLLWVYFFLLEPGFLVVRAPEHPSTRTAVLKESCKTNKTFHFFRLHRYWNDVTECGSLWFLPSLPKSSPEKFWFKKQFGHRLKCRILLLLLSALKATSWQDAETLNMCTRLLTTLFTMCTCNTLLIQIVLERFWVDFWTWSST